jgi:hypothetical protein
MKWWIEGIHLAFVKRLYRVIIYLESKYSPGQGIAVQRFRKLIRKNPQGFFENAWLHLHQAFPFINNSHESEISDFSSIFPDTFYSTLEQAKLIDQHVFNVRGSGPYSHGPEIDWHIDPISQYRWHPNHFYLKYHPAPYPGGPDITLPWELSRCQHFVTLGQAYRFTGDEKFVSEFKEQFESWLELNPWPRGVNWAGPMDIAIRAVNWLWAYALMHRSPGLSQSFHLRFYTALVQHGYHIRRNLERSIFLRTNHYLANLSGLLYLGILLPQSSGARQWANFAISELNKEILSQFYPDGSSFEASTSYHRLSTEMMLSCRVLALHNGFDFSPEAVERLEKAVEFILHMTRQDCTVPLIGDHDNGRLHRLKVWSEPLREWNDFRYLLAIGAVMFQRSDFAQAAGDQWEEAVWLYGKAAFTYKEDIPEKSTSDSFESETLQRANYPVGGYYIFWKRDLHLTLRAGPNGQNGNGGHAHNDKLSLVLQQAKRNILIDPGCYIYTRDYEARNYFRSTAAHTTVRIDQQEQNPIPTNELFSLPDQAPVVLHSRYTDSKFSFIDASHTGYARLSSPVVHRRKINISEEEDWCIISDQISGSGEHIIELFFHVGSNRVNIDDPKLTLLSDQADEKFNFGIYVIPQHPFTRELVSTWQSPGYGLRFPAHGIIYRLVLYLPAEIKTILFWGDLLEKNKGDSIMMAESLSAIAITQSNKKMT